MPSRAGFTLIELLVVIAIIAVLAVVVVLVLNPAGLLQEARDSNRLSDMATLNSAIGLSLADNPSESLGSQNVLYSSVPDPAATSTLGDQCQGLGLPSLPASFSWHCASSSTFRKADGTGWVPISLTTNTFGSSLSQLPMDPVNTTSSRLFYSYATDRNGKYEVTTPFESQKFKLGGSGDQISGDGGTLASLYERGSKLGLMPLDYGDPSLVGYWTFDEGAGSVAYDYSGNNATGSWQGTGTHWAPGRIGGGSGQFASTTTDYVRTASSIIMPTNSFSVAAWFKTASNGDQKIVSNSIIYHQLQTFSGNLRICVNSCNAGATVVNDNNWHYAVVVGDGSSIRAYLDGASTPEITQPTLSAVMSGTLAIGSVGNGSPGIYYTGLIDDVRIYSRALAAAEIQAMYNAGK